MSANPLRDLGWNVAIEPYRAFWLGILSAGIQDYLSGRDDGFIRSGSFDYLSGLLNLHTEDMREALIAKRNGIKLKPKERKRGRKPLGGYYV